MKYIIFFLPVIFFSCAGKEAKVEKDPLPTYRAERDFRESPEQVRNAAQRVLETYIQNSETPVEKALETSKDNKTFSTDWVYNTSKDKYISIKVNNIPERRRIKVRRKLSFTVEPAIHGSKVKTSVQEEAEKLDKNSGEFLGWQPVDSSIQSQMLEELQENIRKL